MKIAWIRIKGFQQFEDTFIDFRHPETGEPLDKICLIGRNGTGKSTLLDAIKDLVSLQTDYNHTGLPYQRLAIKVINESGNFIVGGWSNGVHLFLKDSLETVDDWFDKAFCNGPLEDSTIANHWFVGDETFSKIKLSNDSGDLLIHCPAESRQNALLLVNDVPKTDLNSALAIFKQQSFLFTVSNQTISDFWKQLIYLIKKRENDREEFEKHPDNINKSKKNLLEEFDVTNPDILKSIADIWNDILGKAKLRFDYENAKRPIQLTENLQAYIVNNKNERIGYNKLSTGVRNFIFRFGHIKSLYFNREIKRGLLLVDEPENSLFPDFLLNIIEQYEKVTTDKNGERNTQMFFATHSPIIAAQFEPHERIILEWNDKGSVSASSGVSPIGDDPNDILYQDFKMTEIVSQKGQEVWKAYLDLKKKLSREKDDVKKKEIAEEILKIGREYKFE